MGALVEKTGEMAISNTFDLQKFAREVFATAQDNLAKDGSLVPVAFVVCKTEVHQCHLSFELEEKAEAYEDLVEFARECGAVAIITVNDVYLQQIEGEELLGYYQGMLKEKGADEGLTLTISGPTVQNWVLEAKYERHEGRIVFGPTEIIRPEHIGLLGDWPMNMKAVQ